MERATRNSAQQRAQQRAHQRTTTRNKTHTPQITRMHAQRVSSQTPQATRMAWPRRDARSVNNYSKLQESCLFKKAAHTVGKRAAQSDKLLDIRFFATPGAGCPSQIDPPPHRFTINRVLQHVI